MSTPFALMLLVCLAIASRGLMKPASFLEYPVVVAFLMLGWFIPEAWGVEKQKPFWLFDPTVTWVYVLICMASTYAGFQIGLSIKSSFSSEYFRSQRPHDLGRLLLGAAVTILLGAVCYFLMIKEAETYAKNEQWSGVITAYAFGSQLLPIGAAISFVIALRERSRVALFLFVLAVVIYLPVIGTAVKRTPSFQLAAILGGGAFFGRRYVPSRFMLVGTALLGVILIHQAGAMREYMKQNKNDTIIQAFGSDRTKELSILHLEKDQVAEVQGAVADIAIVEQGASIKPFASIWNQLVSQYVPSFVLGREAKDSMMVDAFTGEGGAASRYQGYFGSTKTGFADTYTAFGPFGFLSFLVIAILFGWLYSSALKGNFRSQVLYIALLSDGLLSITHSVALFVSELPLKLIVVGAVCALSRLRIRPR